MYRWIESTRTSFLPPDPLWSSHRHSSAPSSQRLWTFWTEQVINSDASATHTQAAGRSMRTWTSPVVGEGVIWRNHNCRKIDEPDLGAFPYLALIVASHIRRRRPGAIEICCVSVSYLNLWWGCGWLASV